jgi:hypothetical protein
MVLAALFMIVMFGPVGMDTVVHPPWVDYTFWGIIAAGAVPAAVQCLRCQVTALRRRWGRADRGLIG